jgi:addiction module HigA family antidote
MDRNAPIAGLAPVHPGALLAEVLANLPHGKSEIARLLRISRPALDKILKGITGISPAMALKLGKLFGQTPEFWLNLQMQYDLKVAGAAMAAELAQIPTLKVAA